VSFPHVLSGLGLFVDCVVCLLTMFGEIAGFFGGLLPLGLFL